MQEFEGVRNRRLNRYIQKHTDDKGNPPENYRFPLSIPMDTAIALLRRFEEEPLTWSTNKEVTLQEIVSHLCWLWAKRLPTDMAGNIFEPHFTGQVKPRKRRQKASSKVKGYETNQGRKPKRHLVDLFEQGNANKIESTPTGDTPVG